MPVDIVAIADAGTPAVSGSPHGNGALAAAVQELQAAPGAGVEPLVNFTSLADLFARITAILAAAQDCLGRLEIVAHGSPTVCDGVTHDNAAAFGAMLGNVSLCDEVSVYLSGCNTAINRRRRYALAFVVSQHTPTEAADNVRVTVYGSVGYLSGIQMLGSARTSGNRLAAGVYGPGYPHGYPDAPDASGHPGVNVGSYAAIGDACWRGYREGVRVV